MASNIRVLIVGAGISGLMCGALLEKAGISYEVLKHVLPFFWTDNTAKTQILSSAHVMFAMATKNIDI